MFIRIRGKQHYLWRAIDQNGVVLDILVKRLRNTKGAKRFFRKLLKGLRYALREMKLGSEHRQNRSLNNCCKVSHQPTRRGERHMKRFKSVLQAQQILSNHSPIHNHLQLCRHLISASEHRAARARAFTVWREMTGLAQVN